MTSAQKGLWRRLLVIALTVVLVAGCDRAAAPNGEPTAPAATSTAVQDDTAATAAAAPATTPALSAPSAMAPKPTERPQQQASPSSINGRLLYVRHGDVYEWNGRNSRQLTKSGDLSAPRWSPDGQHIAVVRWGNSFSDLVLLDASGNEVAQLTHHKSDLQVGSKDYVMASTWAVAPSWSPDGTHVLYAADVTSSNLLLWTVGTDGGAPRPVQVTADLGANIEEGVFSPDGARLAFTLAHDTPTQLWVADLSAGTRTQVTDGKATTYDPAWSPDGSLLAVATTENGHSGIWLISPDGEQRIPLVRDLAARSPTWSPDGSQLAFIGAEEGKLNVYVVDITHDASGRYTAGSAQRLTSDNDIDGPSGLSWVAG